MIAAVIIVIYEGFDPGFEIARSEAIFRHEAGAGNAPIDIACLAIQQLELLGDREQLAQCRAVVVVPYYRLGRKIVYRGEDLNSWTQASRVDLAREA